MKIDFAQTHKQFPAAAEYLSNMYIIIRDYGYVSHTRLAEWAGVSVPAVTQAIGRLKRLGLVRQERYENVTLTDDGRNFAVKVLRRHYLIERLLVGLLGYPWDKADEEAKHLQSQISDDFTQHLYERLGSPQTCPHGNPMPGAPNEQKLLHIPRLSDAEEGAALRVLRITEEGEQLAGMLAFCYNNGLQPGSRFVVEKTDESLVRLKRLREPSESKLPPTVEVSAARAAHIRFELFEAG